MFDGNHRSRKVIINLSKSTRRRTANAAATTTTSSSSTTNHHHHDDVSNRTSILLRAKQEREKRLMQQRRWNATKVIQKLWRGHVCRIHLVRDWIATMMMTMTMVVHDAAVTVPPLSMEQRLEFIAGMLQPFGLKCVLLWNRNDCKSTMMYNVVVIGTSSTSSRSSSIGSLFENIFMEFLSNLMSQYSNSGQLPHDDRFVLYHRILLHCLQVLTNAANNKNDNGTKHDSLVSCTTKKDDKEYKLYMDAIVFIIRHLPANTLQSIFNHGRLSSSTIAATVTSFLSPMEVTMLQCLKTWLWNLTPNPSSEDDVAELGISCRDEIIVQLLQVCWDASMFVVGQHESSLSSSSSSSSSSVGRTIISKMFQGYLSVIVLGVEMRSSRPLMDRYSALRCDNIQECVNRSSSSSSGSSTDGNVWRWYFVLLQNFMSSLSLWQGNESMCKKDGNDIIMMDSSLLLSWKDDIIQVMAEREFIYIQNISEMLSMSKHLGTTEEQKLIKVWFAHFLGHLLDPLRKMTEFGSSSVGKDGNTNTSRELYCIMSLSSLVAKGVDVWSVVCGSRTMEMETMTEENVEDGEDENEDEDEKERGNHHDQHESSNNINPSSGKNVSDVSSNYKLRRQDLQTIDKLDRLYKVNMAKSQSDIMGWLREQPLEYATKMCEVSMAIGRGDVITQLIQIIFDANSDDNVREEEKEMFCTILSCLLQNSSGSQARGSATSPLLSTLAFRPGFLQELWHYSKGRIFFYNDNVRGDNSFTGATLSREAVKMYNAVICFCDVFSHQLLAIDDEEFLRSFTETYQDEKLRGGILAAEVISLLKQLLYDMYWSKPVVAADFTVPQSKVTFECTDVEKFHRARLLLSGTKLWNSIYARWSRLFRSVKFCNEESWWFPHLVTRHDDESGAMDPRTASMNQDMDIEEDQSIDSRMEIDENAHLDGRDESEALASSFKDPKMARILTSVPQGLPFGRRAKLFSSLLAADIAKTQDESIAMREMMWNMQQGIEGAEYRGREKVRIRRDELYNDSMSQISELGRRLKKKVQVTFISKHGNEEAGVDGGGLFKEFLDDLIKDAFNPQTTHDGLAEPLFVETPLQTLAVNTNLGPSPLALSHYRFLGRVLGKAVYESILVEPQFCLPFLNQLLGQHNTVDDLKNIDPVYYKHLYSLRKMTSEEIASLGLTFELTVSSRDGKSSRTFELIPGGSSMPVTGDNVIRYLHLVAHRRLNVDTARQTSEFLSGFRDIIPASWVRLFSPYELQKVISGDNTVHGFDVKGLKSVMVYGGGYHPSQPIIHWFWQIVEEMTPTQKSKLLKFMTSCSRQPLLGFGHLSPLPCIHQVRLRDDEEEQRLPTSATCMHLLKLPNYRSKSILKEKLLYAIESGAGFELS